ncbi:MFS transporter [Rubinisphaera margarita]|uniref:MFS transporter n=1 Tax=Rubinisphaera margarita TaxID=2909586 RepID=UPI001EE82BAA|nr:MFS transporter [Rubinisphaera margarita]MCG6154535.1 MFS transporter [Rubinisphaera margarita]
MDDSIEPVADDTEYRRELTGLSFLALLATQFFTAFNDNLFRWLVVPIGQNILGDSEALAWGAVLFTLPYLIFAPTAGFLADRFAKRKVIIACKFVEIAVMLLGVAAIWYSNIYLLMFLVFCMGTQSALFSPAKIGAIPELLSVRALSEGNGLMAMVTIAACALGTFAGLKIYDLNYEAGVLIALWPIAVALLGIAVVGFFVSLLVYTNPAADPSRKWTLNPIEEFRPSLRRLFCDPPLARTALGIAFFYFLAILYQVNIDAFGEHTLLLTKGDIALLMPMLVLGIGVGSVAAGWMSGGIIQLGMVPVGAMGIAFSTMYLGIMGWGVDPANAGPEFQTTAIWLFVLGALGSFFYIPLESFLQHRSPNAVRGSILSATNALTNGFMLLAMAMFYILRETLDLSPPWVFFIAGLLTLPVIVASFAFHAVDFCRFLLRTIFNCMYSVHLHGFDKIPEDRGALLVPNHVSWMDGPLLCGFAPRFVRFMIYSDHTRRPVLNQFAALFRVIPLSPTDGPKAIIKSLKDARNSVQSGELVCIFPEGGISRTGRLMTFNKGVLKIVQGTDVPVYPMYIHGMWGSRLSYRGGGLFKSPWRWRRRIDIYVGDAQTNVENPGQLRQAVEEIAATSMQDQMVRQPVLARQFVQQCRSSLFRNKAADSSGAELTGGKLLAATIAFKRVLQREVFHEDEQRVGVLLPPSVGGVLANTALALCDKVSVNLNYTLDDAVMNHCIHDAGLKHVLTSKKFLEKKPMELNADFVFLEDLKEHVTGVDRLLGALQAYLLPAGIIERIHGLDRIELDDCLTIIYTSGSTGEPKGVMLSQLNVLSNVAAVDYMFTLKKDDTLIGVLPFFHSFGYTISMWLVLAMKPAGAYHFNPLDSRQVGKLAEKYRGTIILATPTFLRSYCKRVTPEQFQHLWLVVVGAEKLPVDLAECCQEQYGVSPIEGYGSTEMSPLVAANQLDYQDSVTTQQANRLGTVGQCVPGVFAKVVDPETYEERPLETEGLLFVTGPNVMLGYLNQPQKTAEVVIDGWYNTGDFARIDQNGFITLTGRQSRFSKIGGEMVPHIRIEETLNTILNRICPLEGDAEEGMPLIRLAVTAVPDEKKGERIVVLHLPLGEACEKLIRETHQCDLPNLWLPSKDSYIEVDEIPLLGTGKMDLKGIKVLALERCSPVGSSAED